MSLAGVVARHRRSLFAVVLIAVVAGVLAGARLPVGLFPTIAFPRIAVTIEAGDRPIESMEAQVTRPMEQAARAVPGVTDIRSVTSRGAADLKVAFDWSSDMNLALQRTEAALTRASAGLPAGVTFKVRRMDTTVFPVAAYSLTSDRVGLTTLRRYADQTLAPLLTAVPGVARVDALGGARGEFLVEADPARLRALGLSLADVTAALSAANVLEAAGKIEDRGKLLLTLVDSRLNDAADIRQVVLKTPGGGLVRLGDVASVRLAGAPSWLRVTADGRDAVSVQVYQQPSGDTVRIVRGVADVFARTRASAPAGLRVSGWYDQSQLIGDSARGLAEAIAVGAVLAGLVLLLFLRNLGVTLVAVIVVPLALAITALALSLLGQSFNIMTLGGMAAAIGLIIDDAIVMIEHMERRLGEGGAAHVTTTDKSDDPQLGSLPPPGEVAPKGGKGEAAPTSVASASPSPSNGGGGSASTPARTGILRAAAAEFLRPLAGSSAATILIFLPLAFLGGVTGAFFRALSLTMAIALVASFLLTWLIVPILVECLFGRGARPAPPRPALAAGYRRALRRSAARPALALAAVAGLALVGALAFANLPSGFMPRMDEGGFILDFLTPPGTSLSESDRLVRQIEQVLRATPEVATYSRRVGAQLGGDLTESNTGDFFVRLKPQPRRPIEAVMDDVRRAVRDRVPAVDIETAQLMEDLIGDLTAIPQPIEVKLYGEDEAALRASAAQVARAIAQVRGVTEIRDGMVIAGDAVDLKIDPARAALEGVTSAEISRQLGAMLAGEVATQVQTGPVLSDVRVWIPPAARDRLSAIADMSLRAADGHLFPVSRVASLRILPGQAEVTRENGRRMIAVTARVEGRDMGSAARAVEQRLRRGDLLAPGVGYAMGGLFAEQRTAFAGLAAVFAAALAIVTVLLLILYEDLRIAAVIIAMPLAASCAVGLGLWLAGVELNIMALMGLTMVIGIVTEVAIFYFTEYADLLASGVPPAEALIEAGVNRLRPIAMTTLAAILALAPLALGDSMQKPLAVAIIAGLIAQGPLVLLAMPALFRLIGGAGARAG